VKPYYQDDNVTLYHGAVDTNSYSVVWTDKSADDSK
jgi:hypothetical protein